MVSSSGVRMDRGLAGCSLAHHVLAHGTLPLQPATSGRFRRRAHSATQAKMYVPDSFGGLSPERKAADALRNLFTFIAIRIVLAQLQGSGRGNLAAYNAESYKDLTEYMENNTLTDGDKWLAGLMKKNQLLGVRIVEVRTAYCKEDFEWDSCKRIAAREMEKANKKMLQDHAEAAFAKAFLQQDQQAEPDKG